MEFGYETTGGMVSGGWWAELEVCMFKKKISHHHNNVLGVISTGNTHLGT